MGRPLGLFRCLPPLLRRLVYAVGACTLIYLLLGSLPASGRSQPQLLLIPEPHRPVVDVSVVTCSNVPLLRRLVPWCTRLPDAHAKGWRRHPRELHLDTSWFVRSHVFVRLQDDAASLAPHVEQIRVGSRRALAEALQGDAAELALWLRRPGGIWIRRGENAQHAVTGVDVLFGADAVDPRPSWRILPAALTVGRDAYLSVKQGEHADVREPRAPVVLRVQPSQRFKVVQLADLHLSTGVGKCRDVADAGMCEADVRTLLLVERVLDEEQPDFVVLSGDQVNGDTAPDARTAVFKAVEPLERRGIPYAAIFGNHDDEGNLSRAEMMKIMMDLPHCVASVGPADVAGVGNYHVAVMRDVDASRAIDLYFFDTHKYTPDQRRYPGYDWVKESQIAWFRAEADRAGAAGAPLAAAFIHIPLPEYRETNRGELVGGLMREPPTAPTFNSGLRDALVHAGVHMVTAGHDHANDYCLIDRAEESVAGGTCLCYGGGAGFGGYGGWGGYVRRIRTFEFDVEARSIRTWVRTEVSEGAEDEVVLVEHGKISGRLP